MFAFISYSHNDMQFVDRLCDDLDEHEVKYWRDKKGILPGEYLDTKIEEALQTCTHFLVVISNASTKSTYVRDEIAYAQDRSKHIAPLIIEKCDIPLSLYRRKWIDFSDYQRGLTELLTWLAQSSTAIEAQQQVVSVTDYTPPELTLGQIEAAHTSSDYVRVIAGPGTGKSFVIEERVNWLLRQEPTPKIWVVSFTRASSRELQRRISGYLFAHGHEVSTVPVTTLHSLALGLLRKADRLEFPSAPKVLDNWELEQILDQEFKLTAGIRTLKRCKEIRHKFEAESNTGQSFPSGYQEADPPVSQQEELAFSKFHKSFTLTYSCVLPGEIVRRCVKDIETGTIDLRQLLDIDHLIIDEYQDLNPVDIMFTDNIANTGAKFFVAGDDDQSVYAFRYASPSGLQKYLERFRDAISYSLIDCFRCSSEVLQTAIRLIEENSSPTRVAKSLRSVYSNSQPPIRGVVERWKFKSGIAEARAIANSCQRLIDAGVSPRDTMILLSNTKVLLPDLRKAFEEANLPLDLPKQASFIDTDAGRLAYSIVRIACDRNLEDYLAHRTLLGLLKGVSVGICNNIRHKVIENNLNYLEVFYHQLPDEVFSTREKNAIERAGRIFVSLREWSSEDTLRERATSIRELILNCSLGEKPEWAEEWDQAVAELPEEMNLEELLLYLTTQNDEQRASVLKDVYERIGLPIPDGEFLSQSVRVLTMHSAKGLDAEVVFIPGLERGVLPNTDAEKKTGLVYEAARLLYVATTRARAACILSYAHSRRIYGKHNRRSPSLFIRDLGGPFKSNSDGLTEEAVKEIVTTIDNMRNWLNS